MKRLAAAVVACCLCVAGPSLAQDPSQSGNSRAAHPKHMQVGKTRHIAKRKTLKRVAKHAKRSVKPSTTPGGGKKVASGLAPQAGATNPSAGNPTASSSTGEEAAGRSSIDAMSKSQSLSNAQRAESAFSAERPAAMPYQTTATPVAEAPAATGVAAGSAGVATTVAVGTVTAVTVGVVAVIGAVLVSSGEGGSSSSTTTSTATATTR